MKYFLFLHNFLAEMHLKFKYLFSSLISNNAKISTNIHMDKNTFVYSHTNIRMRSLVLSHKYINTCTHHVHQYIHILAHICVLAHSHAHIHVTRKYTHNTDTNKN